jgi:arylamine N-acetyltransferase
MNGKILDAYLRRIGVARPAAIDAAALGGLHRAHQLAVPFENLSIHLSEPIRLDEDGLLDKIVIRRRGGFCYELNGAFGALLEALGAQVARVGARVQGDSELGPPFDHLAAVPDRAAGTLAGRLRPHVLVAADVAGVALHPQHDLLAAHRRWQDLPQRPDADPD